MENKMICPLSAASPDDVALMPCQRQLCAWWDEDAQACAVLTLAKAARKVSRNGR